MSKWPEPATAYCQIQHCLNTVIFKADRCDCAEFGHGQKVTILHDDHYAALMAVVEAAWNAPASMEAAEGVDGDSLFEALCALKEGQEETPDE